MNAPALKQQVAIVTGASRGIGRQISLQLAGLGVTVVLAARDRAKLDQVRTEIESAGGSAHVCPADLADEASIKALVRETEEKFSRLDILVNNAGITHSALLEETTTQDWNRVMAVNATGPFVLCRESLELLKKSPAATIVNISSVVGIKGYPKQSAYTASKHALRGMTVSLAEEMRSTNVRVHSICMGGVDTEMVTKVRPDIDKTELIAPADIAELVVYCVTHKANAVIDEFRVRRAASRPWFD